MAGVSRRAGALPVAVRTAAACAVAACGVAVAANGCSSVRSSLKQVGSGVHNPAPRTYTVADRVTSLRLDTAGSVTVTGTSSGPVTVTESPSYTKYQPVTGHSVSPSGQLTLGYTCKTQVLCSVDYDIKVPRGTALNVEAREDSVTLTSVTGPVTAQTVTGLINASGISSSTAVLRSDAGSVDATFDAPPASVQASTDAGSITIDVPGSDSYKVDAHAVVGTTTVSVRRSPASRHVITAHSDLGGIVISPS